MAKILCPNPPSLCEQSPNPVTPYSAETLDRETFIGLAWSNDPPLLGRPFNVYPCMEICESQLSQMDADLCAARMVVTCQNPCDPVFLNSAQTVIGQCPDDNFFYYVVSGGLFAASNQLLADRMAFTYGVKQMHAHRICLSDLTVAMICGGAQLTGQIHAIGNFGPFTFAVVAGELPPGISMDQTSPNGVTFSGSCGSPGTYNFMVQVDDSAGSYMRKEYTLQITALANNAALPQGFVGIAYSTQLTRAGFTGANLTWSVVLGVLPDGLTLDPNTGIISGTPTTEALWTFTVAESDGIGQCETICTLNVVTIGPSPILCVSEYATIVM